MKTWKQFLIIFGSIVVSLAVLIIPLLLMDDGSGPIDKDPNKSKRDTISVYYAGCCFIVEDFKLECHFDNGERQVLMEHDKLIYTALYKESLDIRESGPFTIYISFYYKYGQIGTTEFPIMRCETPDGVEKTGLYLHISDAVIYLKMGDYETKFGYDESPWKDGFVPELDESERE